MTKTFEVLIAIYFGLTGIIMAQDDIVQIFQCTHDADCMVGYFCKLGHQFNTCQQCYDCSNLAMRAPSRKTNCPKSWMECGDCLPGFYEEQLTEGRVRDKCLPYPSKEDSPYPSTVNLPHPSTVDTISLSLIPGIVIAVMMGILVLIGLIWFVSWYKKKSGNQGDVEDQNAPLNPPSPSEPLSSLPPSYGESQALTENSQNVYDAEGPRTHESVTHEAVQSKNEAEPFNYGGYRNHLPQPYPEEQLNEETALTIDMYADVEILNNHDRSPSPVDSIGSNDTVTSPWHPGTDGTERSLSNIEEEPNEEHEPQVHEEPNEVFAPQLLHDQAELSGPALEQMENDEDEVCDNRTVTEDSGLQDRTFSTQSLDDMPITSSCCDSGLNLDRTDATSSRSLDSYPQAVRRNSRMSNSDLNLANTRLCDSTQDVGDTDENDNVYRPCKSNQNKRKAENEGEGSNHEPKRPMRQ